MSETVNKLAIGSLVKFRYDGSALWDVNLVTSRGNWSYPAQARNVVAFSNVSWICIVVYVYIPELTLKNDHDNWQVLLLTSTGVVVWTWTSLITRLGCDDV